MRKHLISLFLILGFLPCFAQQEATREMLGGENLNVVDSTLEQKLDYHFCEALKFMSRYAYDTARVEFEKCIAINPEVAAVHFNLGVLDFVENKANLAIPHFEKAYQLSPDFVSYGQALFSVYAKSQQFDKAVAVGEDLVSRFPVDDRNYRPLIDLYAHLGNKKKVLETYEKWETIVGLDEVIYNKISFYHENFPQNKAKKMSLVDFRHLLEQSNNDIAVQTLIGDYYLAVGDEKKALSIYNQLIEKYPNNGIPYLSLYTYYDDAKNDSVQAIEMLKKAMQDKSIPYSSFSDGVLQHLSGLVQNKNYEEAERFMQLVRQNFGDEAEVCNLSARLCFEQKKIAEAVDYARTVIDFKPDNEASWSFLGSIYAAENNDTALYEIAQEAELLFPLSEEWQYYKMIYYLRHEMNDSLIALTDHVVKTLPATPNATKLKADMLSTTASVLWEQKKTKDAFAALDKAIELNPNDAMTLNNYAYFLALCDTNLDKALTMIEKSLKIDNKQANSLDTYAYVLFKKGDYRSARFFMERAINMAEKEDKLKYAEHLGDILFHLDDVEGALTQWKIALEASEEPSEILKKKIETKTYIPDSKIIIE